MSEYEVQGYIHIEGTGEEAAYEFIMESDSEPNEMDVLHHMIEVGIIQIFHRSSELVEEEQ